MEIGMIGVGRMGWHMAARLAAAGHKVTAFDPRPDVMEVLDTIGVMPARSAGDVALCSSYTILMVMSPAQAEEAVWSVDGYASAASKNSTLVIMSSLSADYIAEFNRRAAGAFCVIDAPVSGGVEGAESGSLTVMASGDAGRVNEAMPLFEAVGESIYRLGDRPGLGSAMKSINQSMFLASLVASAEMLIAGVKAGLDPNVIVEVVSKSSGDSWALRNRLPLAWRNNYESGGSLDLMVKDLRSGLELAAETGVDATVTRAAADVVREAYERHHGIGDDPLIIETIEHRSGANLSRTG